MGMVAMNGRVEARDQPDETSKDAESTGIGGLREAPKERFFELRQVPSARRTAILGIVGALSFFAVWETGHYLTPESGQRFLPAVEQVLGKLYFLYTEKAFLYDVAISCMRIFGSFLAASLIAVPLVDGDDVPDLAVGAWFDDDGGTDRGAVWILFLTAEGTVKSHQKISSTEGGFTGILNDGDRFSGSRSLGDLDGDGPSVLTLAVGAGLDDDGGTDRGAVWVLFLNADGTVNSHQKISSTEGGFTGILDDGDGFGASTASLGDLDGDGVNDIFSRCIAA